MRVRVRVRRSVRVLPSCYHAPLSNFALSARQKTQSL